MRRLAIIRAGALVLAVALMACEGVTGPEAPVGPPSFASVNAPGGSFPGWSSPREGDLTELLESEKARIALEQVRSQVRYDSLKVVWDAFLANGYEQGASPQLMCDPLQYAADTKIIGPAGGDMSIGPHKLSIPPGALSEYTVITGEQLVSTKVQVRLSPDGLRFLKQPTLMLSYKHCFVPRDYRYGIAYISEDGKILEWPSSYDDKRAGELRGWIWHFSLYAVAGYVSAGG